MVWVHEQIDQIVEDRKRNPRDDTVSHIVAREIDGQPISDSYARGMVWIMIAGGVDTTSSLTSSVLVHLHRDRELRQRLIAEPDLLQLATEEFLRVHPPLRGIARTVAKETTALGVNMDPGDRILVSFSSSCQDDQQFEDPDTFIADRFPNRHAAFGLGIHRCPGSHLARAIFKEILVQVLDRMPDYEVLEADLAEYPAALINGIAGWAKVPVRFTPGRPVGVAAPTGGTYESESTTR
jgi:cytochrome P450